VLEVLAGVPTIVYGYFALLFVTPLLQQFVPGLAGFNALSPGIVMGIMIMPMVSSLSEDAMRACRRAARGRLRARRDALQTTLPRGGAGGLLGHRRLGHPGVSRAIGETMIVAIAAGQQPRLTLDPRVPVETMTAYIVQVSLGDTPAGHARVPHDLRGRHAALHHDLRLNLVSQWLRERFREEYA
jgi:phosphate transport system permease protein